MLPVFFRPNNHRYCVLKSTSKHPYSRQSCVIVAAWPSDLSEKRHRCPNTCTSCVSVHYGCALSNCICMYSIIYRRTLPFLWPFWMTILEPLCLSTRHKGFFTQSIVSIDVHSQTPVVETCVTSVWRSSWTALPPFWSMSSHADGLSFAEGAQTDAGSRVLLRALEKLFWSKRERYGRQKSRKHLLKFSSKKAYKTGLRLLLV